MKKTIKQQFSVKKLLIATAVLAIIVVASVFLHSAYVRHRDGRNEAARAVTQFQRALNDNNKKLLQDKDYESYQSQKLLAADAYIQAGDYGQAKSTLSDIQKNIPEQALSASTYEELSIVAKQQNSRDEYVKYTKILIAKLKAINDQQGSQYYSQQLKSYEQQSK